MKIKNRYSGLKLGVMKDKCPKCGEFKDTYIVALGKKWLIGCRSCNKEFPCGKVSNEKTDKQDIIREMVDSSQTEIDSPIKND